MKARLHQRSPLYRGTSFSVDADDVTLPNGVRTRMAVVRHPGSAAVVPLFDDGTLLLLRQYRHPVGSFIYEVPSGTMDPGERDPLQCAARELEEETGYRAGRLIALGSVLILPSYSNEEISLFLARDLTPGTRAPDADEIITNEVVSLAWAMEMIANGGIKDALTILCLQKIRLLLGTGPLSDVAL
jgi:ADP-ribose pyrophosphatase